jgi:uncharacterized small protein (DUF1192 family)
MSRSAYIVQCCAAALTGVANESERVAALNKEIDSINAREGDRITALNKEIEDLKEQLGFMRMEFSKLNDILAQKLLTEAKPRRSFFDWLRSK